MNGCGEAVRFKPNPPERFVYGEADQPFSGLPGRAAWCPSDHMHVRHDALVGFHMDVTPHLKVDIEGGTHRLRADFRMASRLTHMSKKS
jgi:hypothetical protein